MRKLLYNVRKIQGSHKLLLCDISSAPKMFYEHRNTVLS